MPGTITPASTTPPTTPTTTTTTVLNCYCKDTTTTTTPSATTSGWYAADAVKSCDDACTSKGLFCNEVDLHAHNNEVDSSAEVLALAKKLGSIKASKCSSQYGTSTGVPNFSPKTNVCYHSSSSRTVSQYNCASKPAPAKDQKQRLCYCSSTAKKAPVVDAATQQKKKRVKVKGKFKVEVSNADAILNDVQAKEAFETAMASEIATMLGLPAEYIKVIVSKASDGRRLASGGLNVDYEIDMPEEEAASAGISAANTSSTSNTSGTSDTTPVLQISQEELVETMSNLNTTTLKSQVNNALAVAAAEAPALKDVAATEVKVEALPTIEVVDVIITTTPDVEEMLDLSGSLRAQAIAFLTYLGVAFAHFVLESSQS